MDLSDNNKLRAVLPVLLVLAGLFLSPMASATDCSALNIDLTTQQAIDVFQITYGGGGTCDTVAGNLRIFDGGSTNISDLNGLAALQHIGGALDIFQTPNLASLRGLDALETVGSGINLASTGLISLAGLRSLVSLQSIILQNNHALVSLAGMPSLASIVRISISRNSALTNLQGFPPITNIPASLQIVDNYGLMSLNGLQALETIGNISLIRNPLVTSLEGLSGITSAGWLQVLDMDGLFDLNGLSSLTSIEGLISLDGNDRLRDIDRLAGAVGEQTLHLRVVENSLLTDLDAFKLMQGVDGDVTITDNPMLADCRGLSDLLDYDDHATPGPGPGPDGRPDVSGSITMSGNLGNCNSANAAVISPPIPVLDRRGLTLLTILMLTLGLVTTRRVAS